MRMGIGAAAMLAILVALAATGSVAQVPNAPRIIYAFPNDASEDDVFAWRGEIVRRRERLRLSDAIAEINTQGGLGDRTIEVRLLARADAAETVYRSSDENPIRITGWHGGPGAKALVRGQIDRGGGKPVAVTVIEGRPLRETLCHMSPDPCPRPPGPSTLVARRRPDALEQIRSAYRDAPLAPVFGALSAIGPGDQKKRVNCVRIENSRHVEIVEIGFRDCWLPAIIVFGSHDLGLRDSVIQGSSYAFAAYATGGDPRTAHSFEITGNWWEPSPGSYRRGTPGCDPRSDWDCPVSIWSELPWGITHDYFWSMLNGALFGGVDLLGNVKFANNTIVDAYNGIRVKVSDPCMAKDGCRTLVNTGFEIAGNVFERIRDNPIEPEGHAVYWIVKHNTFRNVHAAISTDGVAGHDFLVFGNLLAFDDVPGARCRPEGWPESRELSLDERGVSLGRSVAEAARQEAENLEGARCDGHHRGVFIKTGADDLVHAGRVLDRIAVFNNSLYTRSPLVARSPASPIASFNNAVEFAGCGAGGPKLCRQEPDPRPDCRPLRHWTADGRALHSDCLRLTPDDDPAHPGRKLPPHDFSHNAYNRTLDASLRGFEKDTLPVRPKLFAGLAGALPPRLEAFFRPLPDSGLAAGGCVVTYAPGRGVACSGRGGLIGAMASDGTRYDLALPFGYPFRQTFEHHAGADR